MINWTKVDKSLLKNSFHDLNVGNLILRSTSIHTTKVHNSLSPIELMGGRWKCRSGEIGSKSQGWNMREWKNREQIAGVENTGAEKSGANHRAENTGVGLLYGIFQPCDLLPTFPLLHIPALHFWPYRIFHSRIFSCPNRCTRRQKLIGVRTKATFLYEGVGKPLRPA